MVIGTLRSSQSKGGDSPVTGRGAGSLSPQGRLGRLPSRGDMEARALRRVFQDPACAVHRYTKALNLLTSWGKTGQELAALLPQASKTRGLTQAAVSGPWENQAASGPLPRVRLRKK